jgi:hypothetical protein
LQSIAVWPPVRTGAELADLNARLSWYVPPTCSVEVPVIGSVNVPDPVAWFPEHAQQLPENVQLMEATTLSDGHDAVLEWKHNHHASARQEARPKGRLLAVDPEFRGVTELSNYGRISRAATDAAAVDALRFRSQETFAAMLSKFGGSRQVAVFGTGPSMRDIDVTDFEADVVIACNSAVRDPEWMREWGPQVVVFADPVFHFGPSRYADEFRADLVDAVEIADSYVVVPEDFIPLVDRHMPQLADRVIGVAGIRTGEFLTPSPSRLKVARTSNVLTYLMLPLAAALGNQIAIAGCDGRDPDDDYFWRHSKEGQYSDELMKSAMDAHPAFFRDRDYARYYEEHCDVLAGQLLAVEDQGIEVTSITKSYIPALQKRSARADTSE